MTQLSPLSVPPQSLAAANERIRYVVRSDEDPLAHDLPKTLGALKPPTGMP